jgi:hypothetical protein
MRGVYKLAITEDKKEPPILKKGRSSLLNQRRNEALVSRYYFYNKFFGNKLSYEYIMDIVG